VPDEFEMRPIDYVRYNKYNIVRKEVDIPF
jgi:hypothetical protein